MAGKNLKESAEIMPLRPFIPPACRLAFEQEAVSRGIPARHLFRDMIAVLVRDNLFDAVIGEKYPVVK